MKSLRDIFDSFFGSTMVCEEEYTLLHGRRFVHLGIKELKPFHNSNGKADSENYDQGGDNMDENY